MKKMMLFAALAAALTFASCAKELQVDDSQSVALRTVHFSTLPTETKTLFGEKTGFQYPVLWQEGDRICPSFNYAGPSSSNYITVTPSVDGTTASFGGMFAEAESYRFMFVSPAVAFKSINKTDKTVLVEFPSGQTSTDASPAPAAQILFADTGVMTETEIQDPVTVNFSHLSAYLHIQFANVALGEAQVKAVNITNDARYLAGRIFYNWENNSFEANTELKTITVSTSTLTDVWCAVCPLDLSGGELTTEIVTDKGTFTKTVHMPASANLPSGKVAKFTVDMAGVPLDAPVVYNAVTSVDQLHVGDKVIIAAAGVYYPYAMSTAQNSKNRSAAGVSKTEESILSPASTIEVFELEDGVIPGHFAFKATSTDNPGYIYAGNQTSSGDNILQTKATKDNSASWAVSVEDVTTSAGTWENASVLIADIPSAGRGLIRFNATDGLFTAYLQNSQKPAVKLYRLDEPVVPTPRFNVTVPNGLTITSAAQEVPVYVFGNVAWTASVSGGATLSQNSGTGNAILTLNVPAVTETTAYTLTVSTEAAVSQTSFGFNIEQFDPIDVGTVLYWEQYWTGAVGNQKPSEYETSGNASTVVYGGGTVVYSQDGKSKLLQWPDDASVFLPTGGYDGPLSTEGVDVCLRINQSGGYLKVAGVPCSGVKQATLTYKINKNGVAKYSPTSDTDGVILGDPTKSDGIESAWGKTYYEITCPLTFGEGLTQFNFTITDTNTSAHVYVADIKVVVTEMY